jgi:hypothetical protein
LAIVVVEEQAYIDLEDQAPMREENVEVNMDGNNVSDHELISSP